MKVLMYHWTQDDFPKRRGGGIQVYQRDILPELLKFDGIQLTTLSSGSPDLYDFFSPTTRIERLQSSIPCLERFGLINSPIPAPTAPYWGNPFSLRHPETREMFFDFIEEHGFDVIHFNHLEGLPAEVLTIKPRLPNIKILFSMHDYYSLCPQVTFLYQGKELCDDGQLGKKCQSCLPVDPHTFSVPRRRADRLSDPIIGWVGLNPVGRLAKRIQKFFQKILIEKTKTDFHFTLPPGEVFQNWHQIVDLINEHVDYVLPVSDRVHQIAVRHGIKASLLRVLRLGKNEALQFRNAPPHQGLLVREDGSLTLVYLGYMTIHKGFFFMLDAFERMPDELSQKINLVVAAKTPSDPSVLNRLMGLQSKLKSLTHFDGYTPDQLDKILVKDSIGLLCHFWEDTAPQTAWEMHCRRIPLLTSDLGGASELSGCRKMIYEHGNIQEFIERIRMILDGEITHEEYWKNSLTPIMVEEHCKRLVNYYRS
jgi:glycosyltransferase involved in cell wall biosynthesis